MKTKLFSRRNFLRAFGLAAVGGAGGVGYVRGIEPHWLGVGRHEVKLSKAAGQSPLKILQLSDLHASPVVSLEFIGQAIQLGLSEKPDLICLTGDFISHGCNQYTRYADVLSPLAKAAPTFACLGNHDGGKWASARGGEADLAFVRGTLTQSGVKLLHNMAAMIEVRGWKLSLVGLGDAWAEECKPAEAFGTLPTNPSQDATLVLSHNPDTKKELQPFAWDLMLCGHTHGGQVKLPFIGAPIVPVRDRKFVEGLHQWDGRWIHITRGVGNLHGVRFNCPPEVSLLTLV